MNFSADLTFASFSSPSLLKTIAHIFDKRPSMPTSSNGCGRKNDVVPQPVRVWKGEEPWIALILKYFLFFGVPHIINRMGLGILGECAEVTAYLHMLLTQQLCGILCGGSAIWGQHLLFVASSYNKRHLFHYLMSALPFRLQTASCY